MHRYSSSDVFDFLGFTFYWGRSRKGVPMPKLKTNGKRLRSKLKAVNTWGRLVRSQFPLKHIWAVFCSKLRGHIQYYGVSFNFRAVQTFQMKATRILFKWRNRRDPLLYQLPHLGSLEDGALLVGQWHDNWHATAKNLNLNYR